MTLDQFRQALLQALRRHFSQSGVTITESRGIVLTCRVELDADTFVAVYFNALTGKTSYALIHQDQRVAGYDNYRFWHHHPMGAVDQHVPCAEPAPEDAIAELAAASRDLGLAP